MDCKKLFDIPKTEMAGNESNRRVYSTEALSPTVTAIQGGNQEPKVITSCAGFNEIGTKCLNSKVGGCSLL